jgi:hypothetical protein
MITHTAVPERILIFNSRVIVISQVKNDLSLFRIISDGVFKGYMQKREGEYHRIDGSSISNEKFEFICQHLK